MPNANDVSLFNVIVALLLLVVGFLLNRVFAEIDKLTSKNGELIKTMMQDYVHKDDFLRHVQGTSYLIEKMSDEINKRFDKLEAKIDKALERK